MHHLLAADIRHRRLSPKVNAFHYRAYYLLLDMHNIKQSTNNWLFAVNKPALFSFYDKDHGARDGSSSLNWAQQKFQQCDIQYDHIYLLTMPRILGYVFNPVSFWLALCNQHIVAVIAEVHNTYGEQHSYICYQLEKPITPTDWFVADKRFHVSPFYDRIGNYHFNFDINIVSHSKSSILIHYYINDKLQLLTSMTGVLQPMSKSRLLRYFFYIPLMTIKVITLIHYQAVKLWLKKIPYRKKPIPYSAEISLAKRLTKDRNHVTKTYTKEIN